MKTLITVITVVIILSGCSATPPTAQAIPNDPSYAPIIAEMAQSKISDDGSIFQATLVNSLYSDVKARRVGDIITVNLRENTTATKSASTTTTKESDATIDPLIGLGGQAVNIGGQGIQMSVATDNEFSGDASANQSNNLRGNISVTVLQVLPNMNLVVRGEKWLTLNNGDEYIRLTGIVRPADISPSNEIDSGKIANARIQYSGTGSFSDSQHQGWLSKFFNSPWWPL